MEKIFSIKDKVAIITGGSKGIGEAICRLFARQGAHVIILDIDDVNGRKVEQEISEKGGAAAYIHCDVSDHDKVSSIIKMIASKHNRIDILVNNAGVAQIGKADSTSPEAMKSIIDINILGVYNCLYATIPIMKDNNGGVILNLASVASVLGIKDRFGYSMTKGAVLTMTYSVAKDYLDHNIRCNAIGPARVHTPFVDGYIADNYPGKEAEIFEQLSATQPIGRMGKPEEIAYMALYLCSDEAGFLTGGFYPIDGGFITLNT